MTGRILLIEDDEAHRETLRRHLSRSGHDVTTADSAERALGLFATVDPELVLTDVRMPGMNGIELLERLRAAEPATPVLVMTAYGDMHGAIDAMRKGAYDYLVKPLDLDQVDAAVGRCLHEQRVKRTEAGCADEGASEDALVGRDPRMIEIYKTIGAVAEGRTPVLVRGETGTGKELIARILHRSSPRRKAPFMPINCAAVPEGLLETELFGHVRGAFTGAVADRRGRFEAAGAGTVFLDEIGDTTLPFQSKLLRVLQEREFHPVGSEQPRRTEARIIAATHRPIEQLIEEGTFREDLYFRLRVVEITIPPLRERRADIPLLVRHVLGRIRAELERDIAVTDDVMGTLVAHDWPGNVRELENSLTRAAVLARGPVITLEHLSLGRKGQEAAPAYDADSLDAVERAHVQRVLSRLGGNKSRTAETLGISRPRLDRIIEKHHLVV